MLNPNRKSKYFSWLISNCSSRTKIRNSWSSFTNKETALEYKMPNVGQIALEQLKMRIFTCVTSRIFIKEVCLTFIIEYLVWRSFCTQDLQIQLLGNVVGKTLLGHINAILPCQHTSKPGGIIFKAGFNLKPNYFTATLTICTIDVLAGEDAPLPTANHHPIAFCSRRCSRYNFGFMRHFQSPLWILEENTLNFGTRK